MSKEIKFRAWTTRDKCWIGGFCIHNSGLYSDLINARIEQPQNMAVADAHWQTLKEIDEQKDRIIIMQFTGLKDKNGKEIYEGDVISEKVHSEPSNWASPLVHNPDNYIEVGFINGSFCNAYTERPLSDFLVSIVSHEIRYEIIGNIYETPELLKP